MLLSKDLRESSSARDQIGDQYESVLTSCTFNALREPVGEAAMSRRLHMTK